ncbi:MAG: site-specific DNA-methyltransferase [Candidatus Hadarchaeales archaeon]
MPHPSGVYEYAKKEFGTDDYGFVMGNFEVFMEEVRELPVNQIINGDPLEVMFGIKSESVDLIFADFPFRPKGVKKAEFLDWNRRLAREFERLLKETGSLYILNNPFNVVSTLAIYTELFHFRNMIIIPRHYKYVPFGGKMFAMRHNCLLFFVKNKEKYVFNKDYGKFTDVWDDIHYAVRGKHTGSIPEEIVKRAILASTNEGDLVLDPFVGFGTSAIVAKKLNRRFIGIDIDENHCKIARDKLGKIKEEPNL